MALELISVTPANAAPAAPGSNVVFTFNAPIAFGSGSLILNKGTAYVRQFDIKDPSFSISGSTLVFNPPDDFAYSTRYAVALGSNSIVSVAGVPYAGGDSFTFLIAHHPGPVTQGDHGSDLDDHLSGGDGSDEMFGYGGDDFIGGGGGNDVLEGGDGGDELWAGAGNDKLYGGEGRDFLYGEAGNDVLEGGSGDDELEDRSGQNRLDGGAGDDYLRCADGVAIGGPGNDLLSAIVDGAMRAVLLGGDGDDTFSPGGATKPGGIVESTGGAGIDTFRARGNFTDLVNIATDFVAGAGGDRVSIGQKWYGLNAEKGSYNPFANGTAQLVQEGQHTLVQIRSTALTPAHTVLILQNVNAASLVTDNFDGFIDPHGKSTGQVLMGGAGTDYMMGGWFDDEIDGGAGDDWLEGSFGNDRIHGGAGLDTAPYYVARESRVITHAAGLVTVSGSQLEGGVDVLSEVERLRFDDVTVAFDGAGTAGQVYRIYQAAFDRTPDAAGLGYWIAMADRGTSLQAICSSFAASSEFKALYGADPGNGDLVERFYQNVLHRPSDAAGKAYWVELMNGKTLGVADVLGSFSESQENQDALAPVIGQGMVFKEYFF